MLDFFKPAEGKTIRLYTPEELGTPVRLPARLIQKRLVDIPIGTSVWEVPWAMWVDRVGACWMSGTFSWDGNHHFDNRPQGTADMRITRVQGGFKVDMQRSRHRWGFEDKMPGEFDIPVVELVNY